MGATLVSTVAGLTSALANTAVGHMVLAPGTYFLSGELSITRSVVIEAAVAGSVVLSGGNAFRVLNVNPGSSGVVQLIGLNITGGRNTAVRASCSKVPIAPMGKWLTCLTRLTLAQLRTLRSTTVGACCRDLEKFPSPRWESC